MMPGMGGMNPKKMQQMMKQLGINQEEIDAARVVIEKSDGSKMVVEEPQVTKISMGGQDSFQVQGVVREEVDEGIKEEDVEMVAEKTGKSEDEARSALQETGGDLAEAIVKLSE